MERLMSNQKTNEDSDDVTLRPHTLDEYIGQDVLKENLRVFIQNRIHIVFGWLQCNNIRNGKNRFF